MKNILYIFLSVLVMKCVQDDKKTKSISGQWKSLGNSWVLDIASDSTYVEYDVTEISCLQARNSHIKEFGNRLYLQNDTLKLLRGAIEYRFVRSVLPQICENTLDEATSNNPLFNYDVFASTVKDNYAFMELNNVNWDSLYQTQRKKLAENPSNLKLYEVIDETYTAIKDNHGSFEASEAVYEELEKNVDGDEEKPDSTPEIGDFQVAGAVARNHLQTEMTRESSLIQWGKLTDNIGYIQVKAMFLYTRMGMSQELIDTLGWEASWLKTFNEIGEGNYIEMEREGIASIMKVVMDDLKSMDSIVLDLRFNGGGQDLVSLELLSWFNDSPKVIAHESLFDEGKKTPTWDIILPSKSNPFTKPVYLLTSQQTGSAAEVAAMASLQLPHVTRIGMPTMGALSTALEKKLPNGWDFAISNEYYRTPQGEIYENKGIPVAYKLNYPHDRQEFFRSVMNDLKQDKREILDAIEKLENKSL